MAINEATYCKRSRSALADRPIVERIDRQEPADGATGHRGDSAAPPSTQTGGSIVPSSLYTNVDSRPAGDGKAR